MPLPGRDRPLEQDADFLQQEGIRVLVSLTEIPPDGEVLTRRAIDQIRIPIQDYAPPTLEQMIEFVVGGRGLSGGRQTGGCSLHRGPWTVRHNGGGLSRGKRSFGKRSHLHRASAPA